MRAMLRLEHIGAHGPLSRKSPWVARIKAQDERWGYDREFVNGQYDYSDAKASGSRGVYLYYALEPGVYEVFHYITWNGQRRYFCRSEQGELIPMTKEEVDAWLNMVSG